MSLITQDRLTYDVLTEADSYPYLPLVQLVGIAIANDGVDTVTVVVDDGERDISLNVTTSNRAGTFYYKAIRSINVTAGSTFQIQLFEVDG